MSRRKEDSVDDMLYWHRHRTRQQYGGVESAGVERTVPGRCCVGRWRLLHGVSTVWAQFSLRGHRANAKLVV